MFLQHPVFSFHNKERRINYGKNRSQGFTIIELLVVVAIIGILASIILISIQGIREKTRDTRRLSDINEIVKALGVYYTDNLSFPVVISPVVITGSDSVSLELEAIGVFSNTPTDPLYPDTTYQYTYSSTNGGGSYSLSFCLETNRFPPYVAGCGNLSRGE